jgi:DNA-binding NarL/FixJ family response regulator
MTIQEAGRQILLIDDDELVCGSLRQFLQTQGCAVDVADDAASAEALMKTRAFDVVVVDPYLTTGVRDASGANLVKRIRALQPHAALIVLTGYDSPALLRLARRHDVRELLAKPRSIVAIGEAIGRAMAEVH